MNLPSTQDKNSMSDNSDRSKNTVNGQNYHKNDLCDLGVKL